MRLYQKHIILGSIAFICTISIAFRTVFRDSKEVTATLLNQKKVFEAGNAIVLDFKLSTAVKTRLFLHTSYGSTSIDPEAQTTRFVLPDFVSEKKGILSYTLVDDLKVLSQGEIAIRANTKSKVHLESYIGPPSIIAGGKDYTMPVIIASDAYDNPLADSTKVIVRHQFLDIEKEEIVYSKDMIGWKNIFSYDPSGRILLFSKVKETISKEFSVEVYPSLPEDFEIESNRKHTYADGNQITEFTTSIIRDEYDNIVSDGSTVQFVIKDTNGSILQVQGSTLSGKATARILHPDHKDTWQVKAYIYGMAESNEIRIEYTPVIDDFEVDFTADNRKITVGPLVSFMEQLIPDGATVKVIVFKENRKVDTMIGTSYNGVVRFLLKEEFYNSGIYDIQIIALGVQKIYKKIVLQ